MKRNPECVSILLKRYVLGSPVPGANNMKNLVELVLNATGTDLLESFLDFVDFVHPSVVLDVVRKNVSNEVRQLQQKNVQIMIGSGKLRLSRAQKHDIFFFLHRKVEVRK